MGKFVPILILVFCLIFIYEIGGLTTNETQTDVSLRSERVAIQPYFSFGLAQSIIKMTLKLIGPAMKLTNGFLGQVESGNLALDQITSILMEMNKKLDELIKEIQEKDIIAKYNGYVDQIEALNMSITSYTNTPNAITEKNLRNACDKNSMEEFIIWLYGETSRPGSSIFNIVSKDMDSFIVEEWDNLIFYRMRQAITSYVMCFTVVNSEHEDLINETLFGKPGSNKGIVYQFEDYLTSINNTFGDIYKKIDNFAVQWKNDVTDIWNNRKTSQPDQFIEELFSILEGKYNFVYWLTVLTKSPKQYQFRYTFGPFSNQTMIKDISPSTKSNQELLVMFRYKRVGKIDPIHRNEYIEKCVKKIGDYPSIDEAKQYCPDLIVYTYIFHPSGLYSKMSPESNFEKYVYKKQIYMFGYGPGYEG